MKKFQLAPQERIEAYETTACEFFRSVLRLDYLECVVTDEGRLADFASCGMPEEVAQSAGSLGELNRAWDVWVVPVICKRYRLIDISPRTFLVDLFERIEKARRRSTQ